MDRFLPKKPRFLVVGGVSFDGDDVDSWVVGHSCGGGGPGCGGGGPG